VNIRSQVLITSIVLTLLSSCISGQGNHVWKKIKWIDAWLASPSCNPPCWEGVTPGKTTLDQAYVILNTNPQILNATKETNYVAWSFQPKNDGGSGLIFSENNDLIEVISLRPRNGIISLGETIEKFGEPDQVLFTASDSDIVITYLVYSKKGMALVLSLSNTSTRRISSNEDILGIDLFVPGYDFSGFELTMIVSETKWIGYSIY